MGVRDPYLVLGVEPGATDAEIRSAFRRAVRNLHPDTAVGPVDDAGVRAVIEAYRVLIDPATPAERVPAGDVAGRPARAASCRLCGGAGVSRVMATCHRCRGHAEITALDTRSAAVIWCRTCGGRGRVMRVVACAGCGGTGAANDDDGHG